MDADSKKPSFVEAAKVLIREGIKKRFPTHDAAIAEIDRLQSTLNQLEQKYQLATHKRKRGRPSCPPENKKIDLRAFPFVYAWVRQCVPVAKGGRPSKKTHQEKIDFLKAFDDEKQRYAKEKRKKSVTDKEFIEFQINADQKMKAGSERCRAEKIACFRKNLKYFRDETGIRQKRKTP